jgi:hypothetical protein
MKPVRALKEIVRGDIAKRLPAKVGAIKLHALRKS